MKARTLDVLDRTLSEEYDINLNACSDHKFKFYKEELMLDPVNWDDYYTKLSKYGFNWTEFKYEKVSKEEIKLDSIFDKDDTGVYLFIVKSNLLIHDMPKFVLYVGIAGENDTNRPLKDRLRDYFYYNQMKKRGRIHMLLRKYYKNVYVAFSYLNLPFNELRQIETDLHGFFYPIYSERDFPAPLKKTRKSFPS